jgi:hypothetical protein
MARKKEEATAFSVRFPVGLVEEIDQVCSANYITRTSWLIKAAKELLERERLNRTEDFLAKLAKEEK